MIKVEIVADSVSEIGARITTFLLTYPRFIHSEFMTHRMFSRNASSSRAIPVSKQIQEVINNPAIPMVFTKNQRGMQGGEILEGQVHELALSAWLNARDAAVSHARALSDLEVHKQYANRLLEPFAHITVVCTATEWANFFALRCHEAAQPEIHELADKMYDAYTNNNPKLLKNGQWHLPFINHDEDRDVAIKCSVARCARVSYKNHDGTRSTVDQDIALYNRLLGNSPIHASPAEHQAQAVSDVNIWSGNFRGWIQYRKTLDNENVKRFKDVKC